jgi:flagellum-specific peptidoglycan hydrolase FlgJ
VNSSQRNFLDRASGEALKANCLFPQMAACEAALESNYGNSELATRDNNLFGLKLHSHPDHPEWGLHSLPTREFENGEWITINSNWMSYPDWNACFQDRMGTLYRLSNLFPHYAAAVKATDPETYVRQVSQSWSTDPAWRSADEKEFLVKQEALAHDPHAVEIPGLGRALKVISIYEQYLQAKENGAPCTSC